MRSLLARFAPAYFLMLLLSASTALTGCGGAGNNVSSAPSGTAALTLSAASLSFPATNVGSTSASQIVMLSSTGTGTATVNISGVTVSDTTDYALTTTCSGPFGAGTSCTITVAFTPKSAGSLPAVVSITDNLTGSPQTITLAGSGTAVAPALSLSTTTIAFGSAPVGTGSSTASPVTLSNTGNAALTLGGITLSDTKDFAIASTCGSTLAAGATCALTPSFTPQSAGQLSGVITIADNATPATATVTLTGTGTAMAQAVLSPSSLSFSATATNTSSSSQGMIATLSNPGTATLTGIGASLSGTGANAFSLASNCGTSLVPNASCSLTVTFGPNNTAGTYTATLSVADSATGSPQTTSLTGTETATGATVTATSIAFPTTTVGATSTASTVTLSNTGSAPLSVSGIVLGGANAADFATTNNCGTTVAVGSSCTISATFTPAAAQTYSGTITVTDNAPGSPQTVTLTGAGAASAVTRTLYTYPATFPENLPDASVNALYALVNNAQQSIDMTMYELVDTTFSGDLVTACGRGVKVRVLLDASLEKSANTPAYNQLNTAGANCSAVFSNTAFQATHQKSMLIDGVTSVIMTLNLTSRYYTTTRDFALVENDAADYAAIEATFNADYAAGTPYNGTQGASDFSYTPTLGDDLIWSPTTAQAAMLALINNANSSLLIENEELSSSTNSTIVAALTSACQRGVVVHFTIVDQSSYEAQFTTLKNAGCSVHTYPNTSTALYIHAKVVVADYGLSTQNVYMGSINYSSASMTQNRELGLYLSDAAAVQTLYTTLTSDYNGGTAW